MDGFPVRRTRAQVFVIFITVAVALAAVNPAGVTARSQAAGAVASYESPPASPQCNPGQDITASADLYSHFLASGSLPGETIRDGNESTNPGLIAPHVEDRYWRYTFPAGTTISTYRIHQVPWAGNTSTHYYIVSSDSVEGPWTVRGEHFGEEDTGPISISPTTDSAWRIYSVAGNNGWGVFEWRMFTAGAGDCIPVEQLFGICQYGHQKCPVNFEHEPVNTAIGNYVSTTTDLSLPGRGISLDFARTYNSLDTSSGVLGVGWRHVYEARLVINPDGTVRFFTEDGAQLLFGPDGQGGFTAPMGVLSELAPIGGGYEITRHDQVRYRFDTAGTLTAIVDRNANELTFSYTAGKLIQITDTVGRTITLGYDANERLASLSGPPNRSVSYTYDPSGRLATVTDASGGVWEYGYDASDRLTTITDPNDHVLVTNEYGADGRVSAQTNAVDQRGTFDWDSATQTSTYTDARGGEWVDDYDGNVLQSRTDPLGNTTTYGYDANLNLAAFADPRSNTTTFTYDPAGNLLTRTAPSPPSYLETWTYTALNDIETYTDGRSHTTTYDYDPAGNLITLTAPLGAVADFGRDPAGTGLLVSLTDPRDKTTTYGHDGEANLTSITTPLGNETTMTYDPAGRMLTVVEPRGNAPGADPTDYTTTFTFDAADHLLTITDPLSNAATRTYDPGGNLESITDARDHTTAYGYDNANHLTSVTDALDGVTAYAFDEVGNLISRTDAKEHLTTYGYDMAGRLTGTTDSLNHSWTLTYDDAGNVATHTDAKDNTTSYAYDELNRLTGVTYAAPSTPSVTYGYDANSNLATMIDGVGTETYTYDDLDRLTAVTRGPDTFSYVYDLAGNLTSRTYPGQSGQTWVYDDDGRLTSANGATYTYDEAAQPLTAATSDGLTARYSYDPAGRLLEVAHTSTSATLSRFTYALDPVGNRTAMTTREGTVTYRYDPLDRLTEACWSQTSCPAGPPASPLPCLECIGGNLSRPAATVTPPAGETYRTYTYDPVGNRLTEASDALALVTERDSVSSSGIQANGASQDVALSADGRYVAFQSAASDLVSGDTNAKTDIFVRDRQTGIVERVSVGSAGAQATNHSYHAAISDDGRYVVFESLATNLVTGDTNAKSDIFLRDRTQGKTTRLSIATGVSGAQANNHSYSPAISGNGAAVTFESIATNLITTDTNGASDVFVRVLASNATTRVSVASAGTQGNGSSTSAAISGDGRYVAYQSAATNLVTGDTNGVFDIFVRDRTGATTTRLSLTITNGQANNASSAPVISADGNWLAFQSTATNLVGGDTNGVQDVFARHRTIFGSTGRVSVASSGIQANAASAAPAISGDGSYVAFHSSATNLVASDTNAAQDAFIFQRTTGTTTRLSVTSDGTQSNGASSYPSISGNGANTAFESLASNLVSNDTNVVFDVFLRATTTQFAAFAYDAADRITTVTRPGGLATDYDFDANGNETGAGSMGFTYDLADRLKTATVGAITETYTYAGDGTRLSASTGAGSSQTTKFIWDRVFGLPQLAIERDGANTLLRSYSYGLDLLRQTAGATTYYIHHDGLGSAADVASSSGSSLAWSEYYPYGQVRQAGVGAGAPTIQPFAFAGEQLDPVTNLYHLRARQYDVTTGRFLQNDPLAPHLAAPSVASYVYADNDPTGRIDPAGTVTIRIDGGRSFGSGSGWGSTGISAGGGGSSISGSLITTVAAAEIYLLGQALSKPQLPAPYDGPTIEDLLKTAYQPGEVGWEFRSQLSNWCGESTRNRLLCSSGRILALLTGLAVVYEALQGQGDITEVPYQEPRSTPKP
jgi:RHS repeat-associated protein